MPKLTKDREIICKLCKYKWPTRLKAPQIPKECPQCKHRLYKDKVK